MNLFLGFLCPGFLQFQSGHRWKGISFCTLALLFLGLGGLGPLLLQTPQAHYDLRFPILAQSPEQGDLLRWIGFGYFFLTGFCSLLDSLIYEPKKFSPPEESHLLFKEILQHWLKKSYKEANQKIEEGLSVHKRDFWLFYLKARIFFEEGRLSEAKLALKNSTKYDHHNEISFERSELKRKIEGGSS